jgi:hypothetical protein
MNRRLLITTVLAVVAWVLNGEPIRATGNLEMRNTDGKIVNQVWHSNMLPIVWRFNDPATVAACNYSSTSAPVATLLAPVAAGFSTWQDDPDSTITFSYGGTTSVKEVACDGTNVVTFCSSTAFPTGVLAMAATCKFTAQSTVGTGGGCPSGQGPITFGPSTWCAPSGTYAAGTLIDADIQFNTSNPANAEESLSTGDPNNPALVLKYDVQALALHETGHVVGLCHDPISHAVMCPTAKVLPFSTLEGGRVLQRSDLSTAGHYYPEASYASSYGSITGSVTLDGLPADGAHVVAVDPNTMLGAVGRVSLSRQEDARALGSEGPDFALHGAGFYRIDGLPPGGYYVYVEYFDASDRWSGRLSNGSRYNHTIANSNVSNGNAGPAGQSADWLGFMPALAEFYDAGESGNGGDGVTTGTATDNSDAASLVPVAAGQVTSGIDIAINIEFVNGQTPAERQNPTARGVLRNDDWQSGDYFTPFYLDSIGNDNFYAIRYPAALLPSPPFNVAEGKWLRIGKSDLPMTVRLTYGDPTDSSKPALNDPVVPSAGRVLSGGPNGMTEGTSDVDVRDQWNVTVNESRDVWIVLNQPPHPPGTVYAAEGYYVQTTRTAANQARVNRTLRTLDGGSTWSAVTADVLYDLILETAPPVQILGATPASGEQGATLDVTVSGVGFKNGATLSFGPDITVNTATFLSAAELRANVTIPCNGSGTNRAIDVKVTNPEILFPNVSRVFTVTPSLTDSDCDGEPNALDCAPNNAAVKHAATEVTHAAVSLAAPSTVIAWDSQGSLNGSGTVYDVVAGQLSDVRATGNFAAATCGVSGIVDPPFTDPSPNPAAGDARYWLVRARNECNLPGRGTYGDSTLVPDPRDALDAGAPCP